jgi:hypothetical protein
MRIVHRDVKMRRVRGEKVNRKQTRVFQSGTLFAELYGCVIFSGCMISSNSFSVR